ncbi:MAG: aconitase/3-isopropylmalate dehydratase large subunit family protein [Acidobacteriota bacterium]
MPGKTIIEKIFTNHSEEEILPGKIVWIDLDIVSARDFGGPNVVKNFNKNYEGEDVFDPSKVFFTFDLTVPPKTIQYANNQTICRNFAKEKGIRVFDIDKGIGTHTLIENGLSQPGSIVVGTDSHMNILGAVNSFGQGMGDVDITFGFKYGRTWFEVPETVKVNVKGNPSYQYTAKDLVIKILSILRTDKILGKAVEFYGDPIEKLDLPGRITFLSMITEMGGIVGFIPFSEKTVEEIKEMAGSDSIADEIKADENAEYSEVLDIDISDIESMVSAPPYPHNGKKVSELEKIEIDFGFVGSCTNGRYEDLLKVWTILKGKKIKEGVKLSIVPATIEVYKKAFEQGILKDLLYAGAIISNPGCGGCAQGHIGMTGKGDVMVSTGNRNFPGKQGDGFNYLTSPEVVAYSVLNGFISDREY